MRWQDNKTIRKAITIAHTKHPKIPITIHGWICIDPTQLSVPSSPKLGEYRGTPSAITFLMACESLLRDNSKQVLGNIKVFSGSIQTLS